MPYQGIGVNEMSLKNYEVENAILIGAVVFTAILVAVILWILT